MESKQTKQKRWIITAALLISLLCMGAYVFADAGTPGSETDPVVTKSYVDAKIAELSGGTSGGSPTFTAKQLLAGQKMIGKEGTQIILRSGEATAIGNASNGVSDLTSGQDLMTGAPLSANHLLLIPREDSRGIAATTEIWVMVSGGYTIQ